MTSKRHDDSFDAWYQQIINQIINQIPPPIRWANTNNITLPSGSEDLQLAYLKHYYPEAFL